MKDILLKRFQYYKNLGDKTFSQLNDSDVLWLYNSESNSIATIVQHISGNMISRWTNFLTEDGEKENRNRDIEFEISTSSKSEMLLIWEKGWNSLFHAFEQINDDSWDTLILIRGEAHSLWDAVLRQFAHYAYHVGQIVYIAKMLKNEEWKTLSIARNTSSEFNREKKEKKEVEAIPKNSSPVCYLNSDEVRDEYKI